MNQAPRARKRAFVRVFGERCEQYDKDCATCIAYRMLDEVELLRKEKKLLQDYLSHSKILKERIKIVSAKYREACEENHKIAKLVTGTFEQ